MKTGTMVKDRARRSKRRRRAFWLVVVIVAGTFLNLMRPELIFDPHITPSDELRIRWERVYTMRDLEIEAMRFARLSSGAEDFAAKLNAAGERARTGRVRWLGGSWLGEGVNTVAYGYGRDRFLEKWDQFTISFKVAIFAAQGFSIETNFDQDGNPTETRGGARAL